MKCELPREKLIGYLYDEVDAEGKAGIESHISTCPACAQALERLGRTRNLMRAWADEVPARQPGLRARKRPLVEGHSTAADVRGQPAVGGAGRELWDWPRSFSFSLS